MDKYNVRLGKDKDIRQRKNLNTDALIGLIRSSFKNLKDHRSEKAQISLADVFMSAFAMFSLKEPSILSFEKRISDANLMTIYKVNKVPCDTQMRTILDEHDPVGIEPLFSDIFCQLQRGKCLEKMVFMDDYYLLSIDATGYFSSNKIHCNSCCTKTNSKTGKVTYHHQMLSGAIVHPDFKEVIPVAPEPIIKQDGEIKNDIERNASKRFLTKLRKTHPHLRIIVVEDSLYSNAPHIRELENHNLKYIIVAKKGDHAFLFNYIESAEKDKLTTEIKFEKDGVAHRFRFMNNVPLNESNQDQLVNFVEYWETTSKEPLHFSWVTNLKITEENVFDIMRGGRARWKIENETFNTLKNQGYHFEHNFGHGNKNLSVIFAMLMMLAFLVDQVQQIASRLFNAVWEKLGTKRSVWENIRILFYAYETDSMEEIFKALFYGLKLSKLFISDDPPSS